MNKSLPHNHGSLPADLPAKAPDLRDFDSTAELFKLLSDSRRMQIFWLLCHCEECVINISALLEMSSPAVSHHLKLLKTAGLVISRREGKEVYYTAGKTHRSEILHRMLEGIIELACPKEEAFEENHAYDSAVQTVNEVHNLLVSDLKQRYTIEELSLKFHINQTTLKTVFKRVFGQSIAAFVKGLRIKRAMEYLTQTDMPISQIAREVGYESQSKFTQAFKGITEILPKDFRKQH